MSSGTRLQVGEIWCSPGQASVALHTHPMVHHDPPSYYREQSIELEGKVQSESRSQTEKPRCEGKPEGIS